MTAVTLDGRDTESVAPVQAEVVTDLLWLYATAQDRIEHIRVHVAPSRVTVVFFTLDDDYSARMHGTPAAQGCDPPADPLRKLCSRMIGASSVLPGWRVRC